MMYLKTDTKFAVVDNDKGKVMYMGEIEPMKFQTMLPAFKDSEEMFKWFYEHKFWHADDECSWLAKLMLCLK
jgi:hypothetical protein